MTLTARFTPADIAFEVLTECVVIDCDPEMADYDNPRGERVGIATFVAAHNAHGDRVSHHLKTGTQYEAHHHHAKVAQAVVKALTARAAAGKLPVAFSRWEDARPVYGSDAYVEYGQADDLAWEAREAADEGRW